MFLIHPLSAHFRVSMHTIHCLPGGKHIAFLAERKVVISLLQDHYRVPHLVVQKMHPEGATTYGPPWVPSHWSCDVAFFPREEDNIYMWIGRGRGGGSHVLPSHPVMDILLGYQVPRRQVHIALGAEDPLAESLLVC